MRRRDKEIANDDAVFAIIDQCQFARIAFSDGNRPYIIPVCFGFEPGFLYFHCANEGYKIDILKKNPNICFQMDCDSEIITSETACNWGVRFKSVIGYGVAEIVADKEAKSRILSIIMRKYSDKAAPFQLSDESLLKTCVVAIAVSSLTAKRSGFRD
jgi:nitroimidazol reductase NimA-like FMN-containing flavoprotein (pyridoxamine 5'-phosphate oxidase superfamily)